MFGCVKIMLDISLMTFPQQAVFQALSDRPENVTT